MSNNNRGNTAGGSSSTSGDGGINLNPIDMPTGAGNHDGPRSAGQIKVVVLHSTETSPGPGDLKHLKQVLEAQSLSVHVGNNPQGDSARYISDLTTGRHVQGHNTQTLGIEQIGYAAQTSWPDAQIENTAKWIALWATKYDIPITRSKTHGVAAHADLNPDTRSDPGAGFPWAKTLRRAAELSGKVVIGNPGMDDGDLSAPGATLDESTAKAGAFATYFNIEGMLDGATSLFLKGDKSLMNDKPLLPFVQQVCAASLRRFQSMPNGNFYAFYPDYFGGMGHRSPYWEINDLEIVDGQIQLNDDNLATHVFVVGDTVSSGPTGLPDGITLEDMRQTAGVVSIFNAFQTDFITGHGTQQSDTHVRDDKGNKAKGKKALIDRAQGENFLRKYGARPLYEEMPMVRSPYYEAFLAYQRFCLMWAAQFATEFKLTYMPELFPGGIVSMPQHGIQMFIEEVQHDFDFETGFTTSVTFSAPASLNNKKGKTHEGMIRAGALEGH